MFEKQALSNRRRTGRRAGRIGAALVGVAAVALTAAGPAGAAPLWPGGPEVPSIQELIEGLTPPGVAVPQIAPEPPAPFSAPSVNPSSGETVGVAQPIIIRFNEPVGDRAAAERAIRITSQPPVDGHFYWASDTQVRWKPFQFWPANTSVTVKAGDTTSSFTIGDALVTVADNNTKTITITRNGEVVRTMPTSFGKPGYDTPNGTYIVGEKYRDMYMDSSTYGVPVDAPEGYRTYVEYATRMSNSGIFLHAAPWSEWAQGNTNVSHGCLNVSTEDGRWFYENAKKGDPVIVQNTAGGTLNGWDGLGDWNL
ncbi:Ig-like domain-containing protein [Rhodococcus sp. Z13]|uniref:Ig-like domain-containing protein n=1 Tax=Rhodococcus sacchari TaxID=2962047 RepID=A0ACD4DF68_9NOCA|nr:Ig-like domain-containing protein [Rhodococcus sp. Z13]UYP18631.1 Ig-like domain-containing protein [Rhodococcus sp. Z13]